MFRQRSYHAITTVKIILILLSVALLLSACETSPPVVTSTDNTPDPPDFIAVEQQPVPTLMVWPDYPEEARLAGIKGDVWVKVLVQTDGKVKKAVIIKSDSEIFDQPAIAAALQWEFTPAIMNKVPVACWQPLLFRFPKS